MIVVDMKVFYTFNMCATLRPFLFLVDDTVEGKNILEKKTRERVDIRMYHFSLNFLQLGVICCGDGGSLGKTTRCSYTLSPTTLLSLDPHVKWVYLSFFPYYRIYMVEFSLGTHFQPTHWS